MNGNIKQTKNERPFSSIKEGGGEQWNADLALDETKPWNATAPAAAPAPALRSSENGSQALDFLLGILKDGKDKNPQDARRSISWDDVDKRSSVHWTDETSSNRAFESRTSYETAMVPPLKKRLSSGFARGLALPGWMNGSFLDENNGNENHYFNPSSSSGHHAHAHATPRAPPRFDRTFSIGSRPSLPWTVSKGVPMMSEPLLDTPCPSRYYENLGLGGQTPTTDQPFGGHRFGGVRNPGYSEGIRRGSTQGSNGMEIPFAPRDTGDFMFQYPPPALSRDADISETQLSRKREHPSEITNLVLDGKLIKVRKVTSGNGIRLGGNVLQVENYVTVGVEQDPLQVAESKGSFPSLLTHSFDSLDSNESKPGTTIAPSLQSAYAGMKPTDQKPTVSFDTLDRPNKNNEAPVVQGCICKRSRCLKLYCKCFQTSNYCDTDLCRCKNCHNTSEFDRPGGERRSAIKSIKSRRPDAFGVRPTKKSGEGCSCKKNRCLKKYCDCYATGAQCTSDKCTCNDCSNGLGGNDSKKESDAETSKKESETEIKVSKAEEKEAEEKETEEKEAEAKTQSV